MATTAAVPFIVSNWKVAYQAALLEYRGDGLVGTKLEAGVTACINALQKLTNHGERIEKTICQRGFDGYDSSWPLGGLAVQTATTAICSRISLGRILPAALRETDIVEE